MIPVPSMVGSAVGALLLAGLLTSTLAACSPSAPPRAAGGRVVVVAAEDIWGSIAEQIGGRRALTVSLVDSPDVDPHSYEPTAQDARSVAQAGYVIANGVGYDPWFLQLVRADPARGRRLLDVGALVGRRTGANPHLWYDPPVVTRVAARIADDLGAVDPADADYFRARAATFTTATLAEYDARRTDIRRRYAGIRIGATESVFDDMARNLDLRIMTPDRFMNAVAEGNDVTAADTRTVDRQIRDHEIAVLVVNRQNAPPEVARLTEHARSAHIPVVPVTETPTPRGVGFAAWQSAQLRTLQTALAQATGR